MALACFSLVALLLAGPTSGIELEISNVQATWGPFGPERKSLEYFADRDSIGFRYDLKGVRRTEGHDGGEVKLSVSVSLADGANNVVHLSTHPLIFPSAWGLTTLRGFALLEHVPSLPEGEYTFRATVREPISHREASFERKVRLKPVEFGVSSIQVYYDEKCTVPAATKLAVGYNPTIRLIFVSPSVRDGKVEISVRHEIVEAVTGESLSAKDNEPVRMEAPPGISVEHAFVNVSFGTGFRPGKFLVQFTITDRNANKTINCEVPLEFFTPD